MNRVLLAELARETVLDSILFPVLNAERVVKSVTEVETVKLGVVVKLPEVVDDIVGEAESVALVLLVVEGVRVLVDVRENDVVLLGVLELDPVLLMVLVNETVGVCELEGVLVGLT